MTTVGQSIKKYSYMFTLIVYVVLFRLPRTNCKTEQQPNLSHRSFSTTALEWLFVACSYRPDRLGWAFTDYFRIQASSNGHTSTTTTTTKNSSDGTGVKREWGSAQQSSLSIKALMVRNRVNCQPSTKTKSYISKINFYRIPYFRLYNEFSIEIAVGH
jgi:hypothetical protein